MEVILLERVAKLGQMGEVVRVKDGFARNYLLPKGKALRATEANKSKYEGMKVDLQAKNLETKAEADKIGGKLDGKAFPVIRQASETGQLYGSVTPRDLATLLTDNGFEVDRNQIALNMPIKTIGQHKVPVHLHPEVEVTVTDQRRAQRRRGRAAGARRERDGPPRRWRGRGRSRGGQGRGGSLLRAGRGRGQAEGERRRRRREREARRKRSQPAALPSVEDVELLRLRRRRRRRSGRGLRLRRGRRSRRCGCRGRLTAALARGRWDWARRPAARRPAAAGGVAAGSSSGRAAAREVLPPGIWRGARDLARRRGLWLGALAPGRAGPPRARLRWPQACPTVACAPPRLRRPLGIFER